MRLSGDIRIADSIESLLQSIFILESSDSRLERLSSRELEVVNLVRDGYTQKQIAEKFSISLDTIKTHVKNIKKKLNIPKENSLFSFLK